MFECLRHDGTQMGRIWSDNIDHISQFFEFVLGFPNATGTDGIVQEKICLQSCFNCGFLIHLGNRAGLLIMPCGFLALQTYPQFRHTKVFIMLGHLMSFHLLWSV